MERSMSFSKSLRPTAARLAGLAGLLALPLLAGCVYDDGYYGPSSSYGYGYYGPDYGYGGYGYGSGYGYYGNPCWPYGCGGYRHHRHHGWGDDDDNNHHHHHGSGSGAGAGGGTGGGPPTNPGPPPPRQPYVVRVQPDDDRVSPNQPSPGRRAPSSPYVWVPQQKDSKN
jgi:hypothetical protein